MHVPQVWCDKESSFCIVPKFGFWWELNAPKLLLALKISRSMRLTADLCEYKLFHKLISCKQSVSRHNLEIPSCRAIWRPFLQALASINKASCAYLYQTVRAASLEMSFMISYHHSSRSCVVSNRESTIYIAFEPSSWVYSNTGSV